MTEFKSEIIREKRQLLVLLNILRCTELNELPNHSMNSHYCDKNNIRSNSSFNKRYNNDLIPEINNKISDIKE